MTESDEGDPTAGAASDPLTAAVTARDADTIAMVDAALARREAMLAYQPVIPAADTTRPAFQEGLIRLLDPTGRVIPARDFMPAVEATETGRRIDCLALELGLRALAETPELRLAVNMSARSIGYPPWRRTLEHGLGLSPTVAERLILEITESSAMLIPELVTTFMRDLQAFGIAFALDDFGAGYTAFRFLREFHFDILKIDGQFIRDIATSPDNQVLTAALISIGQHYDMLTVAESVETAPAADWLAGAGIDCMQGYHFAAPTLVPVWRRAAARNAA